MKMSFNRADLALLSLSVGVGLLQNNAATAFIVYGAGNIILLLIRWAAESLP